MPDLKTELEKSLPGRPVAVDALSDVYTLFYRISAHPVPLQVNFRFKTSSEKDQLRIQEVISRSRAYCERMNFRFIRVQPFLISLDTQEKAQNGDFAS